MNRKTRHNQHITELLKGYIKKYCMGKSLTLQQIISGLTSYHNETKQYSTQKKIKYNARLISQLLRRTGFKIERLKQGTHITRFNFRDKLNERFK